MTDKLTRRQLYKAAVLMGQASRQHFGPFAVDLDSEETAEFCGRIADAMIGEDDKKERKHEKN